MTLLDTPLSSMTFGELVLGFVAFVVLVNLLVVVVGIGWECLR